MVEVYESLRCEGGSLDRDTNAYYSQTIKLLNLLLQAAERRESHDKADRLEQRMDEYDRQLNASHTVVIPNPFAPKPESSAE
jgi:vacuolar-type H+-ATPase subunit D/Vma8